MTTPWKGLLALLPLFLLGCPQPNETGDTDPIDTDTDNPSSDAQVNGDVTIDGTATSCAINVNGELVGPTGQCLNAPDSGTSEITAGDGASYGYSEDNIPLHKEPDGSLWIAPPLTAELQENECFVAHLALNRFAQDEWTCERKIDGRLTTDDVEYTEGHLAHLPGIDVVDVNGNTFTCTNDDIPCSGQFTSATTVTLVAQFDSDSLEYSCWAGNEDDRP